MGASLHYWFLDVLFWPATIVSEPSDFDSMFHFWLKQTIRISACVACKDVSVMDWMFFSSSPRANGTSVQKDSLLSSTNSVHEIKKCKYSHSRTLCAKTSIIQCVLLCPSFVTVSTWTRTQFRMPSTWNVPFWVADNIVWRNHWPHCRRQDVKWNCKLSPKINHPVCGPTT